MKSSRRIQIFMFLLAVLLWTGGLSCVGGAGPGGAGNGVVNLGNENTKLGGDFQAAANPGSIQAGDEGHGQEQRVPFKLTVATPEGQTNCGKPFLPVLEIFPSTGNLPQLYVGFAETENGSFTPSLPRESFGADGRRDLPSCSIPVSNPGEESGFIEYKFIKATAVFAGGDGKFYQSETKVVACYPPPQCRQTLCEECFTLQDESNIPEEARVRISIALPPPPEPVQMVPPSLPPDPPSFPLKGRISLPTFSVP